MAINDIVQTIAEARVDARSLSEFVFKPAGFKVARRLAPTVDTLQFYINRFNSLNDDFSSSVSVALSSLNNSVAEADGKVAYIETTVQDAINNTVLSSGFVTIDSFELGATLTQRNQALRHTATGNLYRWAGDLPKTVPASSTPTSSGGIGANAWLEVSDTVLRQELLFNGGAALVNNSGIVFKSIADMKAAPSLKAGMVVTLIGRDSGIVKIPPLTYNVVSSLTYGTTPDNTGLSFSSSAGSWFFEIRQEGQFLYPQQFGARADKLTNDRAAISAMLNCIQYGFLSYDFLQKDYYLGVMNVGLVDVFAINNAVGLKLLGMPRMHLKNELSRGDGSVHVFTLTDCAESEIECHAIGDKFDRLTDDGATAVYIKTFSKHQKDLKIRAKCTNGFAAMLTKRIQTISSITGIDYEVDTNNTSYGVRFEEAGDACSGIVRTVGVGRSYYIVGVHDHDVVVYSDKQKDLTDILIKVYQVRNVDSINVVLYQQNSIDAQIPVNIEHQNDTDISSITNVSIKAYVNNRQTPQAGHEGIFRVGRAFEATGGSIKPSTNSITNNISLEYYGDEPLKGRIIEVDTYANNGGLVQTNFDYIGGSSAGFTIQSGDTRKTIWETATTSTPTKISLKNGFRSAGTNIYEVLGAYNGSRQALAASSQTYKRFLVAIQYSVEGDVTTCEVLKDEVLFTKGTEPTWAFTADNDNLILTVGGGLAASSTALTVRKVAGGITY